MEGMFLDCHKLDNLDVSYFDVSKVESFENFVGNCYSLTSLDVSNFDTS